MKILPSTEVAVWSFAEDVKKKSLWDSLAAHTSFGLPLHHYEGAISVQGSTLFLSGNHKNKGSSPINLKIERDRIISIEHGWDGTFRWWYDRFPVFWAPLKITFLDENNVPQVVYIVTAWSRWLRTCANKQWFHGLTKWSKN